MAIQDSNKSNKEKIVNTLKEVKSAVIKSKKLIALDILGFLLYYILNNFIVKIVIVFTLIIINLCFKVTRKLAFSFTPLLLWTTISNSYKFVPVSWRNDIDVTTFYNIEKKLGFISFKLYDMESPYLDIIAWIPYGVMHYLLIFFLLTYLFVFEKRFKFYSFLFFYGLMNISGLITQIIWPTAPLWYFKNYEGIPATYDIHGNPGKLVRIDKLFHVNFYQHTFENLSVVFGAWPSLHSGCSVFISLFFTYLIPKYWYIFMLYFPWIWFSTMYLGHHFLIDLIGGFCYAIACLLMCIFYIEYRERNDNKKKQTMENDNNNELYIKSIKIESPYEKEDDNSKNNENKNKAKTNSLTTKEDDPEEITININSSHRKENITEEDLTAMDSIYINNKK